MRFSSSSSAWVTAFDKYRQVELPFSALISRKDLFTATFGAFNQRHAPIMSGSRDAY